MAASIAPECNDIKEYVESRDHHAAVYSDFMKLTSAPNRKYDTCFLKWYSESMCPRFRLSGLSYI